MKTVGIIGGMGASASCHWYSTIIKMMQDKYHATQDNEYPTMYIFNLALNDWSERGIEDSESVLMQLTSAICKMDALKPDVIIMACNTIHHFIDELQQCTDIPIWNMIELCKEEIKRKGYKKAGVLCSSTTNKYKLYGKECIYPDDNEQLIVDKIILDVQRGHYEVMKIKNIAASLISKGADCIVLGCTELPLVYSQDNSLYPVIDSSLVILNKLTNEIKL